MDKYGEYIGVRELHYAIVTADTETAYTAGKPAYLAPAASIGQVPSTATKTRYYDNAPRYTTSTEGETVVTMVVSGLPDELAAKLMGKPYDGETHRLYDTGSLADAPWVAVSAITDVEGGFKALQYLKGKFTPPTEEAETKKSDITEKTTSLVYTAVKTVHRFQVADDEANGVKRVIADSRTDTTLTEDAWFAAVQTPPEVED